jgi:PAS domain S-box-containing protein
MTRPEILDLLGSSDSSRQAARFRQFVVWELPPLFGVLVLAVLLSLFYDHVVFVALAAVIAIHIAVLVLAFRWAKQERLEMATLAVCASLWLLSITATFFAPMAWIAALMLIIRSAILALPYLPFRFLRPTLLMASGMALVVCLLSLRGDPFGLLTRVPGGVAEGVVVGVTFAALCLDLLLLWQNSERLTETIAALRDSEHTLEQRIVQRTSELAQATHEAQREKLYMQALIQHSPVAIVTTDPAVNVLTWNPAAEQLFGFTAAQACGRNLDDLVADNPAIHAGAKAYGRQVTSGAPMHAITQRTHRDGTLLDVEVSAVPVLVDGELMGVLALYYDLGKVKRVEEALQESHRQLADIINFMPDAVLVIDREGKVIAWNRAMEELTGVKAQEMLGKGDYEYALPFYGERRPIIIDLVTVPHQELEQNYTAIRREGQVLMGETYVPHLKGGEAYLLATAAPLCDSRGRVVGAIEVIRDFTDRKHMEEDLQQAKEAAEAATQAKSAFLATMSHEIRTPMNAVIGMTGLLLDTPLSAEQREFAETIRTSGDALLTIINDILDFSKIEAGRMELESTPLDLRECVEGALDLLATKYREKGLDLAYLMEPDVPAGIVGDVGRLRQILVNLLGNALKFTEAGEVVVTVARDREAEAQGAAEAGPRRTRSTKARMIGDTGTWRIEDVQAAGLEDTGTSVAKAPDSPVSTSPGLPAPASHVLHFSVRDTGIGIPAERMDRLFHSFTQVDSSMTRKYGGTGLGLAISCRLADMMGGRMWAESAGIPGQGSTFHFTVRAEAAQLPVRRSHLQSIQSHLDGKRVLIVDDNATNRHILTLQTRAWGMVPRDTASPHQALSWIRGGDPFDVALLDLQMPEMDGLELAAEIRNVRDANQLPIVMLSSLGPREVSWGEIDLAAYLLKPIKASHLYNALVGLFGADQIATVADETEGPHLDAEMGRRHPLSILLAEDHAINQKLALLVLERLGYRADVAGNGLEALQAVRRQHYDVVLMDVQMPEMDGLEATRAIRREFPADRRPRIVAMTANAMKEDRDECFAAGMDDFVLKPIQFDELVGALNRCQARAATRVAPPPGPAAPVTEAKPDTASRGVEEAPSPVLDPAALARLRTTLGKQADAMLPGLIDGFIKDAPRLIAEARRTWEQEQLSDLRRAAHTLKSGSATFGAMALSALARELEYKARDGALENVEELLTRIEGAYLQAKTALAALSKE